LITLLAAVAIAPTVVVEKLANGATLVAIQIADAKTVSAQTFIRAGSAYEAEADSGVSHLLEHLLFADGIADQAAESAGFLLNATTYREFIRLHTVGPAEAWKPAVQCVAQLLRKPALTHAEKEWKVIAQEDALAKLDPDESIHRALWVAGFKGSAWSNLPMGDTGKPVPKGIEAAYDRFIVGSNVVAVVAGAQTTQESLAELRVLYGNLPSAKASVPPALPSVGRVAETHNARYGIGVPVAGYSKPSDYLAAEIAFDALTSPALLFSQGLEAKSFLTPSSSGSLAVLSFASADGAPGLVTRTSQAVAAPITDAEFADARARVKQRYSSSQPASRALVAGLSVLFTGSNIDFAREVDRVSKAQVSSVAESLAK
jgi:predicted Zn-dependent peptidase